MRLATRIVPLALLLLHLTAVPGHAELTVETYIELTIARLELAEASWRERDEPPSEEQLDELYASYDSDREAYLCFAGEHKRAIEAYLREHEEVSEMIEALAVAIRQATSQRSKE